MRPFRFAVQGGPFTEPAALREHARRVEDLGYHELFSADHLGAVDPFLPLLVAAEATTTLRFGPLVLNNEFHNPALLARSAATFDALTNGRLVLGMGTGYMASEHAAADIELRAPGPRVSRFDEALTALRRLLDDGSYEAAGDHVRLAVDDLGVRPAQDRVPILVGGHGRRVVTLAARHADIFQFTGLTHDPTTGMPGPGGFDLVHVRERHAWVTDAAAAVGRAGEIEHSALVQRTDLTATADESADEMADQLGVSRSLVDATPFVLFGSVEGVCDKLRSLRDELGISHIVIRDADGFAPVVDRLRGT